MVREVKVRMLHRYSSFVIHDDREWKVNQRMLKNNITLFVDSWIQSINCICQLVEEFDECIGGGI